MKPLVTIVTVTHNAEHLVDITLASVNSQSYPNIQHIVKDAGSTDQTLAIVKESSAQLVVCKDAGIYDGMNQAFKHSNGDFILFLNAGDYFDSKEAIDKAVLAIQESDSDFAFGPLTFVDEAGNPIRKWDVKIDAMTRNRFKQVPHPTLLVRRDILALLRGPFNAAHRISADFEMQLRLVYELHARGILINDLRVNFLLGGASTISLKNKLLGLAECSQSVAKVVPLRYIQIMYGKIIQAIKRSKS